MKLPADLQTYYGDAYWRGELVYRDGAGEQQHYHGPAFVWAGFTAVLSSLQIALRLRTPFRLLDVCCGGGDFVRRCRLTGIEAYGFDGSQYAIEHPSNYDIRPYLSCGNALGILPYATDDGSTYEVVTAFDAMEHFYALDVTKVASNMAQAATKHVVMLIGASDDPSFSFFARPGEVIPPELEATVVSGHVTVAPWSWWCATLQPVMKERGFTLDWRACHLFQLAMIEDRRGHGPDGRPLAAWSASRMFIWSRS